MATKPLYDRTNNQTNIIASKLKRQEIRPKTRTENFHESFFLFLTTTVHKQENDNDIIQHAANFKMLRYALTYVQKCDVSQDFVLAVIFGLYLGNKRL